MSVKAVGVGDFRKVMDTSELDLFAFAERQQRAPRRLSRAELNRQALAFLCSQRPFAAAAGVPVRGRRFVVSCAG